MTESNLKPQLVVPQAHRWIISAVAFSPDNQYLLTGGGYGAAILWNRRGDLIHQFSGDEKWIEALGFFPDGATFFIVYNDGAVQTGDIYSKKFLDFIPTPDLGKGRKIAVAAGAGRLLIGDRDGTLFVKSIRGEEAPIILQTPGREKVMTLAFSSDGACFFTASNSGAPWLWHKDGDTYHPERFPIENKNIVTAAFAPSSKDRCLAIGYKDGQIRIGNNILEAPAFHLLPKKHSGKITSLAFAPGGECLVSGAFDTETPAIIWKARGGKFEEGGVLEGHTDYVYAAAFASDGHSLLTGSKDQTARLWSMEPEAGKPLAILQGHTHMIYDLAFSADGRHLLSASGDGTAKRWAFDGSRKLQALVGHDEMVTCITLSSDGKYVATGSRDNSVCIWEASTGNLRKRWFPEKTDIQAVAFTPSNFELLLARAHCPRPMVWAFEKEQAVRELPEDHNAQIISLAFSPEGDLLLTGSADKTVRLWHWPEGRSHLVKNEEEREITALAFAGRRQVLIAHGDGQVERWNVSGQSYVLEATFSCHKDPILSLSCSPDGEAFLTGSRDHTACLWETKTGRLIASFEGHTGGVEAAILSPVSRHVATGSRDTTIRLWEADSGRELAILYQIDRDDWVVYAPSGLFDASPGAMERMHYVVGLEVIELEQLKERYYEPGLLPKLLKRVEGDIRNVSTFDRVRLYPKINAFTKKGVLSVALEERNGGIGKVSLLINGKEVIEDAARSAPGGPRQSSFAIDLRTYAKYFLAGKPNRITLWAYNEEDWLRSPPFDLEFSGIFDRGAGRNNLPPGAADKQVLPALYAVVMGTSNYRGSHLNLLYPDLDAINMASVIRSAGRKIFGDRVYVQLLISKRDGIEDALPGSKENIRRAFEVIAGGGEKAGGGEIPPAGPEDVLFVYCSGHGGNYGDTEKAHFFYLTKDVLSGDLSNPMVRERSVSSREMTDWINNIAAQKQVLILDACYSGRLVERLLSGQKALNATQVRAFDRMKDRTGMFVLTGSSADKVSFEATLYGQGLLTYSLLSGMSGSALGEEGKIDVMRLLQHAADEVPRLAQSLNQDQRPVVAVPKGGASFDIGLVDEEIEIPLAAPKPIFIRSIFQDQDRFDDPLHISTMLDHRLREESAKGRGGALVFVDVRLFDIAYRLRGLYQAEGGRIRVRSRVFQNRKSLANFEVLHALDDREGLLQKIYEEVLEIIKTINQ